ncbi:hypothetical protein [Cellulomonas sp. KH9]|uniref:hypothetical protein n=1 Tax=Cellulomonas sp. KH9 TaxID=1855324 RepID=UPI002101889D|nr:hypothetical protein [Cellulomonas sp. KH9]
MAPAAFFNHTVVASTAVTNGDAASSGSLPSAGTVVAGAGRGSERSAAARSTDGRSAGASAVRGPAGGVVRPDDEPARTSTV